MNDKWRKYFLLGVFTFSENCFYILSMPPSRPHREHLRWEKRLARKLSHPKNKKRRKAGARRSKPPLCRKKPPEKLRKISRGVFLPPSALDACVCELFGGGCVYAVGQCPSRAGGVGERKHNTFTAFMCDDIIVKCSTHSLPRHNR